MVTATFQNSPSMHASTDGQLPLQGGKRVRGFVAENSVNCPLVTVITAVFNGQPYIAGCLESVLRQDYPNIEHIVMDGSSQDGTIDVLRAYDDRIALWKSEPDKGVYDAWNRALAEARGEWICFLGSDDEFLPGAISAYMKLAATHPEAEYLSSQAKWIHPSGYVNPAHGRPWTWHKFAKSMCVAHVGSMHRRSLYDRLGKYDISYHSAADYEFLLRARSKLKTAFMPLTTVMMRAGGVSDSSSALREALRAKVVAGGRNGMLAHIELWELRAHFKLGPLRRAVGKGMARWSR
jgi:glycosyltransferase involved in cell wall biosynthesis